MDDQSRYRLLKAYVDLANESGRDVSGQELIKFYAATTGDGVEPRVFYGRLKSLHEGGDLTAKFLTDETGIVDVKLIQVTSQGEEFVREKEKPQSRKIPWRATLWSLLIASGVISVPGLIFYNSHRDVYKNHELAGHLYPEIKKNLKEINKQIEYFERKTTAPETTSFQFNTYDKTAERFGIDRLDRQISQFYTNLRDTRGYTKSDYEIPKAQGEEVIKIFEENYGIREYTGPVQLGNTVSQDSSAQAPPDEYWKNVKEKGAKVIFDSGR